MSQNGGRSSILGGAQKGDLIDMIREMPCIWDTNSDAYKSSASRQKAFSAIASKLSNEKFQISRNLFFYLILIVLLVLNEYIFIKRMD